MIFCPGNCRSEIGILMHPVLLNDRAVLYLQVSDGCGAEMRFVD